MAGRWPLSPTSRRHALDAVLERSVLSVDDILDCDGVIQEIKLGHLPLMQALAARADALVDLITIPPPPDARGLRRFKRPHAAFESLTAGAPPLLDAMTVGEAGGRRLGRLVAAVVAAAAAEGAPPAAAAGTNAASPTAGDSSQQPSTPPTPGPPPFEKSRLPRLCRALTLLLTERPADVGAWLAADPGAHFAPLLDALAAAPVAELVARAAGADPDTPLPLAATAWVAASDLAARLVAIAAAAGPGHRGDHAAQVLCAAARAPASPLGDALAANAPAAIDAALAAGGAPCARVLRAVGALLEPALGPTPPPAPLSPPVGSPRLPLSPPPPPSPLSPAEAAARLARAVDAVAPRAAALAAFVSGETASSSPLPPIHTAAGTLAPPLGFARLAAADLLAAFVAAPHARAAAAAVAARAPRALVAALASHPHHTILHACVAGGMTHALEGDHEALAVAIAAEDSGLVDACVSAAATTAGRDARPVATSHRAALYDVAAALVDAARARPAVAAALDAQPAWAPWRDGELASALAARGPAGWRVAPPRRDGLDEDGDTPMAAAGGAPPADDPFRDGDGPVGGAGASVEAAAHTPLPASPPESWEEEGARALAMMAVSSQE